MTRLADPAPRHVAWARSHGGIDLWGPDNAPTLSGRHINAHTRWGRAFMRSLWYQHRQYGQRSGGRPGIRDQRRTAPNSTALQIEWGRRLPGSVRGRMLPAGRAVRVRIAYGGQTARRVVQAKAAADRIYQSDGSAGGRYSVAADRDWE